MAGMALAAARLSAMVRKEIEMGCMIEKEVARGVIKRSVLVSIPGRQGRDERQVGVVCCMEVAFIRFRSDDNRWRRCGRCGERHQ